jgi:NAD(P)-dependent dehydrogenase (short-subunit alcohol dehydrogenase family)
LHETKQGQGMSGDVGWLDLQGRVCVVTGAASGIGASVAERLTRVGARVALFDRDVEGLKKIYEQLQNQGAEVLAMACDVSDAESVHANAKKIETTWGPAYALINNAGFLRTGALADVSLKDWNDVLAVNLTGYLLCSRAFGALMRSEGEGSIVHVASISGLFPQSHSGAYSASKAGVLQMSRQLAVEWGPQGVRSNAICPGMIRTPLSAKFYEESGFESRRAAVTASRRIGEPQDVADVALFLASPRSGYVNGAELLVDGGMSCMLMDMVPRPGYNQTE